MQHDAHINAFKRHTAMAEMRALESIRLGLNHEWLAKMKIVDANRRKLIETRNA
jgi:hypothetical protein